VGDFGADGARSGPGHRRQLVRRRREDPDDLPLVA
jgi:hypothetical protein